MRVLLGLVMAAASVGTTACEKEAKQNLPAAQEVRGVARSLSPSQLAQASLLVAGELKPLLTVGDPLPGLEAEPDPTARVWAPNPDGLGAFSEGKRLVVYANHELGEKGVDGRFPYARVSRLVFDPATLQLENASYPVTASWRLEHLCSATFATAAEGMGPGYFLTGEEATGTARGGTTVAVNREGEVTELPWLGKYAHENTVAVPGFDGKVVLIGLDDTRAASELYMYVAGKGSEVLNGRGTLYVFTAAGSGVTHAGHLKEGQTIVGGFVKVAHPAATAADLQTTVRQLGAFPFVRLEDGAYDRERAATGGTPTLYFVDTGSDKSSTRTCGASGADFCDKAGSIYRLELDAFDPTSNARLTLLARSAGAAVEWASPDNIATSKGTLMVQEDPAYTEFKRAPQIWAFPLGNGSIGQPTAVVKVDNPGCDAVVENTCDESSGIIDVSEWLGDGTWLFDVQAHTKPFTYRNGSELVTVGRESGQLLYLKLPGS